MGSTTGYVDVLTNANPITSCPDNCFRPTGLAFSKDGNRLYVASDATGEVLMLQRA